MVVFLNAKDGQVSRRAVALGSVAVRERFLPVSTARPAADRDYIRSNTVDAKLGRGVPTSVRSRSSTRRPDSRGFSTRRRSTGRRLPDRSGRRGPQRFYDHILACGEPICRRGHRDRHDVSAR